MALKLYSLSELGGNEAHYKEKKSKPKNKTGFSCLERIQEVIEGRVWCGAPAVQYGLSSGGYYQVFGLAKESVIDDDTVRTNEEISLWRESFRHWSSSEHTLIVCDH